MKNENGNIELYKKLICDIILEMTDLPLHCVP